MTRKKTDAPATPIRPQVPVTAAELRDALTGFLAAERVALDALQRILTECLEAAPGGSALASTYALADERCEPARDLLQCLTRHLSAARAAAAISA